MLTTIVEILFIIAFIVIIAKVSLSIVTNTCFHKYELDSNITDQSKGTTFNNPSIITLYTEYTDSSKTYSRFYISVYRCKKCGKVKIYKKHF